MPTIPIFGHLGTIRDTATLSWAPGTYTLEGDFTVGNCAKLTLKPGVKILTKPNQDVLRSGGDTMKCEFRVRGTLTSVGGLNGSDSILFTSASSTPANGDWSGVVIDSFGRANFEFTLFRYADTALAVRGDTATVIVYNSTFKNFDKAGVSSRSAKTRLGGIVPVPNPPDCGRNNFLMNTATSGAYAVIKSSQPVGTIKAEGNYWEAVPPPSSYFSGNVDRTPYLTGVATPDSCNSSGAFSQPPPEERISVRTTVPIAFELVQNYPNPFNPTTTLQYALSEPARVELKIFNMLGQVVRTLVDGEKGTGYHQVVWDGKDESGRTVSTGLYLYQLKA
ncbi:MAG: FlgD immunoglobulin-like domain containing protein, partial [Limisphaerales bacterium]